MPRQQRPTSRLAQAGGSTTRPLLIAAAVFAVMTTWQKGRLHPTKDTVPLALRANGDHNHVLHHHVVIVSVESANVPHVPPGERFTIDNLEHADDGIVHLTLRYGFQDDRNIPDTLRRLDLRTPDLDIDLDGATYCLSRVTIRRGRARSMSMWRKRLFIGLAHNAASPAEYFALPEDRTVVMGSHIDL